MNDLQPFMNRGLEPVMKACQGQHFCVPVREEHKSFFSKFKPEETVDASCPCWHFRQITISQSCYVAIWIVFSQIFSTNFRGRNSRKPLRIFKDMKSSKTVSPIVWVSLELSCSTVPQTRSIATFTSSATWRMKEMDCVHVKVRNTTVWFKNLFIMTFNIILYNIPVSPTACMICWRNLLSLHCENKHGWSGIC